MNESSQVERAGEPDLPDPLPPGYCLARIPEGIRRSVAAFVQDLPRLLKEHPEQWVAYHGDEQVGLAATDLELYQICLKRWSHDEFIVRRIEPEYEVAVLASPVVREW
jgi:hypothetical protein